MLFNLNEFLMAVSFALDFVEMDVLGVTSNHSKRVAYMSLRIAEELGLSSEQLHDLVSLAILHDNGVSEKSLHDKFITGDISSISSMERKKEHCVIGEENVKQYPFLTDVKNVIKYHHEKYDGTGFFNLKGEEIPLMSQIIHMADILELNFSLGNDCYEQRERVLNFIKDKRDSFFSKGLIEAFNNVSQSEEFWSNLKSNSVDKVLKENTPEYSVNLTFGEIRKITGVLSKIIDSKSKYTQKHSSDLSEKAGIMADFYKIDYDEKFKLLIAADLHDIGKLAVPNNILDSSEKLNNIEFEIIKRHPYYTRVALQGIRGFEDITEWASNHHEKLNGTGYPFGKTAKELDFNSRLIVCLDIYEALTEERPYRNALKHEEAMEILNKMKKDEYIDCRITEDIDYVFRKISMEKL